LDFFNRGWMPKISEPKPKGSFVFFVHISL